LANPVPGSKKPDPEVDVPVIGNPSRDWPIETLESAEAGVAGGRDKFGNSSRNYWYHPPELLNCPHRHVVVRIKRW